jgi:diguanylate cyclase (GGDEF)-like protein/PAS domain S-box-containing protein
MYLADPADGRFLVVNPALEEFLGRGAADLRRSSGAALTHPHDRETEQQLLAELIAGHIPSYRLRKRFLRPDGSVVWGDLSVSTIHNDDGGVRTLIGQVVDVSETVRSYTKLAEAEELHRFKAAHAADVVFRASNQGITEWISPSVEPVTGWKPEDLIGRDFTSFVHADDVPTLRRGQQQFLAGESARYELRVRCADGSYRWMAVTGAGIRDGTGRVVGRAGGWRDIDAEKRARQELAASEERFRLAMEHGGVGMCLVAPDGHFLEVNEALCRLLGRSPEALQQCTWQELTHHDDLGTDLALAREVAAGRRSGYRLRKRFLRPDGTVVWGDLSVAGLRNDDGSLRCYVSQIVDVSDLIQSQEQESVRVVERNRILDNIPVAIVCATPDAAPTARALYTNRSFEQTFGYGVEDAPTLQDWLQRAFASDDARDDFARRWFQALQQARERQGQAGPIPVVCLDGNGRERHMEMSGVEVDGTLVVSLIDRTIQRRLEAEREAWRRQQDTLALTLTDNMPAGSFVLHRQSDGGPQFDFLSRRLLAMLNLERSAVAADPLLLCRCVHPEDFPSIQAVIQEVYANGGPFGWQGRLVVAGETLWVRIEAEPRLRPDGLPAWDGVVTDISEQQRIEQKLRIANAKLEKLAATDALTGAWNRLHFEQRLTEEIERAHRYGQPLSLLLLDIDHFKAINDRHGHQTGDRVLVEICRRLGHQMRETDLLARWGGEEFVAVLPHTPAAAAMALAERIRRLIPSEPLPPVGAVTVSAGVAQLQSDDDLDSLFQRVDRALYRAKERGRDRVEQARST